MKLTPRALTAAAALIVSVGAIAGCSAPDPEVQASPEVNAEPIVFGVSGPKTGNQAEYGKNWEEGFAIALDEINGAGGVDGREVQIDFQDSQGEASQATTIAQRFVNDESILAVMGDFSSATSMVASPLYQRGGLLQLGISNSHPDFTATGDYIFSPSITQATEAQVIADAAHTTGSKIAVFYQNNEYGNAAFDILETRAEENKDAIVFSAPVDDTSTDFKPQLVQARDTHPDVVIYYTYYASTALLVQQAQQVSFSEVPAIAVGSNYNQEFLDLAGDAAEGLAIDTTFYTESDDPAVRAFVQAFQDVYGYPPTLFAAYAYDGLKQLAWAAEHAETVDRDGIRNALRDGSGIPSIIYGEFSYGKDRRIDAPAFQWLEVQDGKFVITDRYTTR